MTFGASLRRKLNLSLGHFLIDFVCLLRGQCSPRNRPRALCATIMPSAFPDYLRVIAIEHQYSSWDLFGWQKGVKRRCILLELQISKKITQ